MMTTVMTIGTLVFFFDAVTAADIGADGSACS